jgi:hypothetical protein
MISETFFDARQEIERSQTAPVFALCYEGMEGVFSCRTVSARRETLDTQALAVWIASIRHNESPDS